MWDDEELLAIYEAGLDENGVFTVGVHQEDIDKISGQLLCVNTYVWVGINESEGLPATSSRLVSQDEFNNCFDEQGDGSWIVLDTIEVSLDKVQGESVPDSIEPRPEDKIETDLQNSSIESQEIEEVHSLAASPSIKEITAEAPDENGDFIIRVNGVYAPAGIQNIMVPVWCNEDQSDLIWYTAKKDGDSYVVNASIKNHSYHRGIYQINVYIVDNSGNMAGVGSTTLNIELKSGELQINDESSDSGQFKVQLSGIQSYGTVEQIMIAVWNEQDGQDDLIWYPVQIQNGIAEKVILLKDHQGNGYYNVHCYAQTKNGEMIFLKSGEYQLTPPVIGGITAEVTDLTTGAFKITVEGVSASAGVKKIQIPIWCRDDQSDLIWYTAEKQGNLYVVNTDISKHGYHTGTYKVNVYLTDGNDIFTGVGSTELKMNIQYDSFRIEKMQGENNGFGITLDNLQGFGSVQNVLFAVWSEQNGQDDLIWYTADKNANSFYKKISIADHNGVGCYQVHCYAQKMDGSLEYLQQDTFQVEAPSLKSVMAVGNKDTGDFEIRVQMNGGYAGIKGIQVPVWCAADQSDLTWYTAEFIDGEYVVKNNISNHKHHTGQYQVGIYATDGNGVFTGVGSTSIDLEFETGEFQSVEALTDGLLYKAVLTKTSFCGVTNKVRYAVWSDVGGQDDLVWYDAKIEDKNFVVEIPIANHLTVGIYYVNAYAVLPDGSLRGLCSTTYTVQTLPGEKIEITNVNGQEGTFDVTVRVVRPETQVKGVKIPAWCSADQSDIMWYDAKKEEDGLYHATINIKNHALHFGLYQVHAYVVNAEEKLNGLGTITARLDADNYVVEEKLSDSVYHIMVYGANVNGVKATSVRFPTWSDEGSQDDVVWYEGDDDGNGNYSTTIYRRNHKRDGNYTTHIYVYTDNAVFGLNYKAYYELYSPTKFDAYAKTVMHNIIYAVETGGQIYGNARYDCFVQAYTNSSKETAITIGAGGWFATEAKRLLNLIRDKDPVTFASLDTAGVAYDLDNANWSTYGSDGNGNPTILKGSEKAICIQKIIASAAGISVQDQLVDEQMEKYVNEAEDLGVSDLKARMFCANIRHLGGYSAMEWVIEVCIDDGLPLTMDNLWTSMRKHTTNLDGNGVGANKYKSRHEKVMTWLNKYIG